MLGRLRIFFFWAVTSFVCLKSHYVDEIKLVVSYIEKQAYPHQVTFFTCWHRQATVEFLRELAKAKISANILTSVSKLSTVPLSQNTFFVADTACQHFASLLGQAEAMKLFRAPYKWLVFGHNSTNKNVFSTTELLIDSNFCLVSSTENGKFQLKLLYKYTRTDAGFKETDLAIYAPQNGFDSYNAFLVTRNRSDLMGSNINVSYVITKPEYPLDFIHYRNRHIDAFSKLSYALVYHMLDTLNCSRSFIQRTSWGYKGQNDTYYDGGMFGDIQNGTAEIGGTVAFYTPDRLLLVDYVSVTTPSDLKFILKAPPLSYVDNLFTLPFDVYVWYSLYVTVGVTVLILYTIVIYENKFTINKQNNIDNIKPEFFDVVMVQIGAITQQGSDNEPKSLSGRIAAFVIFLILMFLYTAYSANIVVLLQSTSTSIQTVQDLLNSKISLGVEDIIYSTHYFKMQQEPTRKAIYEKKIAPNNQKPNFMSVETGIEKVRNEFFAFHAETTSGYKEMMDTFQEHEKCALIEVDYLNVLYPSITIKKHSPYKELVKVGFRKIYENGIRHRQTNRIYYKKPHCVSRGGTFKSVGIIETYFPLVIFGIGNFIAVVFFLIEVILGKYYRAFPLLTKRK